MNELNIFDHDLPKIYHKHTIDIIDIKLSKITDQGTRKNSSMNLLKELTSNLSLASAPIMSHHRHVTNFLNGSVKDVYMLMIFLKTISMYLF